MPSARNDDEKGRDGELVTSSGLRTRTQSE
jgi:hypothetical protein